MTVEIDWAEYVHMLTAMPAHSAKALQACWDALEAMTPEPRTRRIIGQCEGSVGDENHWDAHRPCPFEGEVELVIHDDSREALWRCPDGHENSERYTAFG